MITSITILAGQNSDSVSTQKLDSLVNLVRSLTEKYEFEKALEINSQAENVALENFSNQSLYFANVCLNFGRIYYYKHEFVKAENYYLKAKDIQFRLLGQINLTYSSTLQSLAILKEEMGEFFDAKNLYLESKSIIEKLKGIENLEYASIINSMGILYFKMGEFKKAESNYILAKDLREKFLGKNHLTYASSLNNLAALYSETGNYQFAESYYLEALNIRSKLLGNEHPQYAKTINNLAILYDNLGDFEKSKWYSTLGIEIRKKVLGTNHPEYAISLSTLASILFKYGDYEQAEKIMLEVKEKRDSTIGREHPDYIRAINNLGIIYQKMNHFSKAESYFMEAKGISEKIYGINHYEYAMALSNLAGLYHEANEILKAEQLYVETNNLLKDKLHPMHPRYATNVANLAMVNIQLGNLATAETFFQDLNQINFQYLRNASHFMSEKELFEYQHKILSNYYRFIPNTILISADILNQAMFDYCLGFKGKLLDLSLQMRNWAMNNPTSLEHFSDLNSYQRLLSAEYSKSIFNQKKLKELESKVNDLEKSIAKSIPDYSMTIQGVRWRDILNKLKAGEVAIEFVHFKTFQYSKQSDSILYAALIINHGDTTPSIKYLFEEGELHQIFPATQSRKMDYVTDLYMTASERGAQPIQSLYELIWKPLEPYLKGAQRIYFSPGGLLHRINLNAIAINEKELLRDRYELVQLGSTRQLVLDKKNQEPTIRRASIFGGIDFETDSSALLAAGFRTDSNSLALRSSLDFSITDSTLRGDSWTYLQGSGLEANEIHNLVQKAGLKSRLYQGKEASEEIFKKLAEFNSESPQILHISTHGYFFPDARLNPASTDKKLEGEQSVFKMSEHPMLRSGLILAGANHAWKTGKPITPEAEDGILTAYEISQLNLRNTELVVLSACETGLGDIQGNEGVYGLQRAFKIAGAENMIMSLWQVPDQQTSELMSSFYKNWLIRKKSIRESLKLAQDELRKKGLEPFYWAGFVLLE